MGDQVIRVLHIIVGLDVGGAETMLKRLLTAQMAKSTIRPRVISLTGIGRVGIEMQALGIEVEALGMRRSPVDIPRVIWQLVRRIRAYAPDIVQTWMYHSDLLGGVAARLAGNRNVIWGIRGTSIPQRGISATGVVRAICALFSYFLPRAIVCCAESVRLFHLEHGYDEGKMIVIPNGYDLSLFRPDSRLARHFRAAAGLGHDEIVIGMVGRFDPLKDHRNFVFAAGAVASKVERTRFLLVGRGMDRDNTQLNGWLDESGFAHRFVLAGERYDFPECLSALDIFCLSSRSEGFPNVVCEAMAMSIPCVVTDVGDAAAIVANTGLVVAPCDAGALANALQTMLDFGPDERARLGILARRRVEENYSIEIAAARFESLYDGVTDFGNRPLSQGVNNSCAD